MGIAFITSSDLLAFALQSFRLVSSEQALKELGLAEHQLRFTCRVHLQDTRKEQETALRVYSHLKRFVLALPHPSRQGKTELSLCFSTAPSRTTVYSTSQMAL